MPNTHLIKRVFTYATLLLLITLTGIYAIDPEKWSTDNKLHPKPQPMSKDYMLSSLNVTAIAQDHKRLIWIGTSAGINVYNGHDYIQFFHNAEDSTALPDDYINVLHCDRQGRMWIGTQNGLAVYTGAYRFQRIHLAESNENVVFITEGQNIGQNNRTEESLYAITTKNVYRIDQDGKANKIDRKDKICQQLNKEMGLAKAEKAAILKAIPDQPQILQKPRELVATTFRDAGGNTWIGYRNAGYQVISTNLIAYMRANDNPLAKVTEGMDITCLEAMGNHLLAGTTLRLYVYNTESKQQSYVFYKDLFKNISANEPRQELLDMVALDNEHVWLTGNHEVLNCRVSEGRLSLDSRLTVGNGKTVLLGSATKRTDTLYIATSNPFLLRQVFGRKDYDSISIDNKWYDEETQLTTLSNGDILLFMKDMHFALFSTKTGKLTFFNATGETSFINVDPAFVRQDSYGNIWLGTKRYGLYRLHMKERQVERMSFVSDVHIQGIIEDRRHQLWITTLKDAICYQPVTGTILMNSLISSSQNRWNRQFFDNALCLSPDSNIVFGSSDGCIFVPSISGVKDLVANKKQQDGRETTYDNHLTLEKGLCIYSLDLKTTDGQQLVLDDSLSDSSHYTFAHDANDLTFGFYYPNYSRRSTLMYQYRLEGYDKDWQEPTYQHEARYVNLAPGKYTFRLRLISSTHLPAVTERTLHITIKPAPWNSAAAWLLYIIGIGAFIYFINSLYLRIRSNRLLLLQEQHEREREQRTNEMNMNFFANISHEFRNPLTIIAGPLLALKADTTLSADIQHTLDRVGLSVNRMLRLIDQMLDFNQLEADALRLRVSRVNAEKEISNITSTFEDSARIKGITFHASCDNCNQEAWIDVDKMEKILSNLFTNALKHTPHGGCIRISMRIEQRSTEGGGKLLRGSIFNSGSHIEEDKLQDVFKRYYQLLYAPGSHHYGWGTGIGLYYVKRLVTLHHGEIEACNVVPFDAPSDERSGVEFKFSLPTDRDDYLDSEVCAEKHHTMQLPIGGCKTAEKSTPSADSGQQKPKILIVDDDIDVAQYIRSLFEAHYEVENRYSAETALADLEHILPDIILSDIIMGQMSGLDFCKRIKSDLSFSHIPVILITAKSNMNEQIDGLRLGAVAYITKPFDPIYLTTLVQSQLANIDQLRLRLGASTATTALSEKEVDNLSGQDRQFMDELYSLMEKHATELDLNVSTVCHDLLISQSKFTYKLKELTGETPGSFFRHYKLNRAAQLIREGEHTLSEISTMVGFSTAAHFSVAFKKQFGVSPSEFR